MTDQEVKDGNRLIADYMGRARKYETSDAVFIELLEYHTSFDWLIPVVHKLYDTTPEDVQQFGGHVIFEIGLPTPIHEVWKAVVDFIKWHNAQKQPLTS